MPPYIVSLFVPNVNRFCKTKRVKRIKNNLIYPNIQRESQVPSAICPKGWQGLGKRKAERAIADRARPFRKYSRRLSPARARLCRLLICVTRFAKTILNRFGLLTLPPQDADFVGAWADV